MKKDFKSVLLGFLGGIAGVILLAAAPGTSYFGSFNGPVRAQNLILTNFFQQATNPITAGVIDCTLGYQMTNCSANPTLSAVAGASNGLAFSDVIVVLANGADRTLSVTAPNVHVYPSGTLTATNGSFAILSVGGVGGTYTGAVFLAFP